MIVRGKLKWFDPARGYGFAVVEGMGEALVHKDEVVEYEGVKGDLKPGATIEFFMVTRLRAVQAKLVARADEEPAGPPG